MAVTRLNQESQSYFIDRLSELEADSQRQWGTLTPPGLCAHFNKAFRLSLGEDPIEDKSIPILRFFLRIIFFQILPWPKGKIKAPDLFTPEPTESFDREKEQAIAAIKRFVELSSAEPERKTVNYILGPLTLRYWSFIHGKHLNHHLQQFGK